jgi:YHS domain-containing protein
MATLAKDPVCGMDVDPDSSPPTSEYNGTTYYFCAPGCKLDFDADPEKYLSPDYVPSMGDDQPAKRWWEFWK